MSERELMSLLVDLGIAIRERLRAQRLTMESAASVVEVGGTDTIFGLDRHVEQSLLSVIQGWPLHMLPVGIYAEGLPTAPMLVGGDAGATPKYWLLIDPIDGTRGLMYEKRSAYFLAAAAPGSCSHPRLSDCVVSVAVELPAPKAGFADTLAWVVGDSVRGHRHTLADNTPVVAEIVRPSTASDLSEAFGSVVAFFPAGKHEAAKLAEQIAAATKAQIFDDQYISTGGQMIELISGHDRFVVDIRPFLSPDRAACCHPYDLALAPLAKAAGIILCAPDGTDFDAPFDLSLDVAWCGYANEAIRALVQPVVSRFISEIRGRSIYSPEQSSAKS